MCAPAANPLCHLPAPNPSLHRTTDAPTHLSNHTRLRTRTQQAPLQPLQDNLESQTYETFEKDVTKYACYQAAVAAALVDRVPEEQCDAVTTVLMVVGAGVVRVWCNNMRLRRATHTATRL
jgi:hypothetical protein